MENFYTRRILPTKVLTFSPAWSKKSGFSLFLKCSSTIEIFEMFVDEAYLGSKKAVIIFKKFLDLVFVITSDH